MKSCEGFPQVGCPNAATVNLLGYELCDTCADKWRMHYTDTDINQLRKQLAAANEHIKTLIAAIDELDSIGEWIWSEADDATLLGIHITESHHTELTDHMLAARAWLSEVRP